MCRAAASSDASVIAFRAVIQRRVVCLTNIPTPYRLFQFGRLNRHLSRHGYAFEVWFMARSEPRRNWSFPDSTFGFEHRFLNGSQFSVIDHRFHFNPGILSALRESRPEILLVSGSWTDPTIWLASISACARRTIFWSESHLGSTTRTSFVARLARRFVLRRFREFAVPGTLAKEYVERHVPASRTFLLPNVVDPVI